MLALEDIPTDICKLDDLELRNKGNLSRVCSDRMIGAVFKKF
jgi:hypothetical protein